MARTQDNKQKKSRPSTFRLLLNNQLATAGLVLFSLIVLIALLAPVLPLPDPDLTAPADRLLPVGTAGHLLGTDALGRDLLSRLIWGARVSLAVVWSAPARAVLEKPPKPFPAMPRRAEASPSK